MTGESEQGNDGVTQGREILRRGGLADAARVFAQCDVANVMGPVFDPPMTTPLGEQLFRARLLTRHAGHGVVDFGRLAAVAPRGANDTADLRKMRPVDLPSQTCAGLQATTLQPATRLLERFRYIKMQLPPLLRRRGKKPPETRRQSTLSASADCL